MPDGLSSDEPSGEPAPRRQLLEPGTMVDGFKVMRLLGEGGVGEVYLARDTRLGRKIALKLLLPHVGAGRTVERFLREAQATARFSHQHIVTVHAVGEHAGRPYIALEYIEGETLRARMRADRPSLKESLRIALAVAEALREAHRHGVLHRDLKPDNVLLGKDGRPRVVDFGLAQVSGADGEPVTLFDASTPPERTSGELMGTPAYMAPEQWLGQPCTPATDVWALGLILHELVHGALPVSTRKLRQLVRAVTAPEALPEPTPPAGVPDELFVLIRRCLAKAAPARPHIEEILAKLEAMIATPRARAGDEEVMPFRGLHPFTEQHADFFFGRAGEVLEVLERLREHAVLPIVGMSGAGKSSFVQAGVLPRLREQGAWTVIQLRPGGDPLAALARALTAATSGALVKTLASVRAEQPPPERDAALAGELRRRPAGLAQLLRAVADESKTKVLLLIDQMEELHTHVTDADERRAFLVAVCTAADDRQDPVRVCFTVRDDFLGRLAEDCDSAEVRAALSRVLVLRTPGPPALAEILTRPLEIIGYRYEAPSIVEDMVSVIRGEQAGLPLLQFAARMLWERRDRERRLLLVSEYHAIGGVAGALAEHAESTLGGMTAAEIAAARTLLLRLVTPERTRHVVRKDQLLDGLPPAAGAVADRLIEARLLAVRKGHDEPEVELAHESLVHRWSRFSNWIDESKEELVFLAELEQAARLWERRGRRSEEVWHGDALAAARLRIERLGQRPSTLAGEFLGACERFERGRRRRRRALWGTALVVLLVAAVAGIVTAVVIAEKERVAARRLAESLREAARAALARGEVFEARATLRSALESEDSLVARALWRTLKLEPLWARRKVGAAVFAVAITPDGRTAVVSDLNAKLRFIDLATLEDVTVRGRFPILSVAPLPDNRRVMIGTFSGRVGVADREAGTIRYFTPIQDGQVSAVVVVPDGARGFSLGSGGLIRQWDLATGIPTGERQRDGVGEWMARSPDGRLLALGGAKTRIEDATTGALRRELPAAARSRRGRFSPDGAMLAIVTDAPAVEVYSVSTGERLFMVPGVAHGLAFSHRGGWLALCGGGGIRLFDLATRAVRAVVPSTEELFEPAISPDDRWIVAGDARQSVLIWDVERARAHGPPPSHDGALQGSAMSPDGRLIASGGSDGSVVLWSGDDGRPFARLPASDRGIWDLAVHPDRTHVYTSDGTGVRVWNVEARKVVRVLSGEQEWLGDLVVSQDGRWLAALDGGRAVRVWRAPGGEPAAVLRWPGAARAASVAASPDGQWLASGHDDGTIRVWAAASGRLVRELSGHRAPVVRMSFGPDGTTLASLTYGADPDVRLWDLRHGTSEVIFNRREVLPRLFHRADGSLLLTDMKLELFDAAGRHERSLPLPIEKAGGVTSDGKWIMIDARLISLETLLPRFRGIGLLGASREVLTDAGWARLDATFSALQPAPARWRRAAAGAENVSESTTGEVVCIRRNGRSISGWARATDQPLFEAELAVDEDFYATVAHPRGCVVLVERDGKDGVVRLYESGSTSRTLAEDARALGRDGDGIVVATRSEILRLDRDFRIAARYAGLADVSVVAGLDDTSVLIGAQGNAAGIARQGAAARLYFEDVPGEVTQLLPGPKGTAVAGTFSGHVGLWSVDTGRRLDVAKLSHPVERIDYLDRTVYALSGHGERLAIDLSVYEQPYCDALRDVWARVPVVWENGGALRRAPGAHRCAR
jgi:WD40 repeat protein